MKKIISVILLCALVLSLCSCGRAKKSYTLADLPQISGFKADTPLPDVQIDPTACSEFLSYLNYDGIECPYSGLFGIEAAFAKKASMSFDVPAHTYNFLAGSTSVDPDRLYERVKANNKAHMEGVAGHFHKELSTPKLKNCCRMVADTVNWGIQNVPGLDMATLSCILGNLKILARNTMNRGTFNEKNDLLVVSPDTISSAVAQTGNADIYEATVVHETMHLLQCRCTDVVQAENDHFIGTSYTFEELGINPLRHTWLYEASAELNATRMLGLQPGTYRYMIDNLESISLATVPNDNVSAGQLEKLCFTKDEAGLYNQLGFADKTKAAEFMYAVELLRDKPEDFKTVYENEYGELQDYGEFLKVTYNPYFVEVVSKLLYKNLAQKLCSSTMSLNDVFYIISLYELDLLKDIPFDNPTVREKYLQTYEQYIEMQNRFFDMLGADVRDKFEEYSINYGDGAINANASLDWLDGDKRDYLLYRNSVLYKKTHKSMAACGAQIE